MYKHVFMLIYFSDDVVLQINRDEEFQAVFGFGGSFTDAAGINILSLSEPVQKNIIEYTFFFILFNIII